MPNCGYFTSKRHWQPIAVDGTRLTVVNARTHAWALLTGCKDQFLIQKNKIGKFTCRAKYDTEKKKWADHGNAPSDGHQGLWHVPWPKLGGGGKKELDEEELFQRLCAWDDKNRTEIKRMGS
jgi:hypothetical protein